MHFALLLMMLFGLLLLLLSSFPDAAVSRPASAACLFRSLVLLILVTLHPLP